MMEAIRAQKAGPRLPLWCWIVFWALVMPFMISLLNRYACFVWGLIDR